MIKKSEHLNHLHGLDEAPARPPAPLGRVVFLGLNA